MDALPSGIDPEQRIDELHAWIATHENGGEGIIATILPGIGSTPMVSSRRHVMEAARDHVAKTAALLGNVVAVKLVTYRRVG